VNAPTMLDRVRARRPPGTELTAALEAAASHWERDLGRATFGAILAAGALTASGVLLGPGRLEIALLTVLLAVMVTARLAGFWASLVTTFVAAVLVDLGWLYPAIGGPEGRTLDLAALGVFGLVAVLSGRAMAAGTGAAPGTIPAARVGDSMDVAPAAGMPFPPAPGSEPLTPREIEVLALLAEGLSNDEIAERLFVTANTVKTHLSHAYAKLGATSRTSAVARARAMGLDLSTGSVSGIPAAARDALGAARPGR
jgi:DNA-binding CsgD family transcriptional regulator